MSGGVSDLKFFFIKSRFKHILDGYGHRPLKHPIIVLVDNDDGSKEIFGTIKENYKMNISIKNTDLFFHITDNLYLIKTPEIGANGVSCIEDFFPKSILHTDLEGKKFNPKKVHGAEGEYGKFVFAEKVVRPNADTIDFSGFAPLLARVTAVIDHYTAPG